MKIVLWISGGVAKTRKTEKRKTPKISHDFAFLSKISHIFKIIFAILQSKILPLSEMMLSADCTRVVLNRPRLYNKKRY